MIVARFASLGLVLGHFEPFIVAFLVSRQVGFASLARIETRLNSRRKITDGDNKLWTTVDYCRLLTKPLDWPSG
jgi:hypothetical protein